jgi:hypothetical protein
MDYVRRAGKPAMRWASTAQPVDKVQMHISLKAITVAMSFALAAPVMAQQAPGAPPPVNAETQAKQAESERQLLVYMFAIRDYCKETVPDHIAEIDASWAKNTFDVPAPLMEFSKTPNFAGLVTERTKTLHTGNSNPEFAARLKASCEQMSK